MIRMVSKIKLIGRDIKKSNKLLTPHIDDHPRKQQNQQKARNQRTATLLIVAQLPPREPDVRITRQHRIRPAALRVPMVMVVVMMMMPPSVGTFMVQSVAAIPVVVLGVRTGPVLFAGLFRTQPRRRRSGGDRCRLGQGVQVVQVVEVVETGWWGQVVKVRIVLGGRGRREGVVVVGFGIFGTFLEMGEKKMILISNH